MLDIAADGDAVLGSYTLQLELTIDSLYCFPIDFDSLLVDDVIIWALIGFNCRVTFHANFNTVESSLFCLSTIVFLIGAHRFIFE